jgi:hypothetical protein
MPIVSVSHKRSAPPELLELLAQELPEIVSQALACAEEPYSGNLHAGDVNLRFLPALTDREGLDYLLEIRTRKTESRRSNVQQRSEQISAALETLGFAKFGVWIELSEAAWSQA